jgi:hypothetical protein
VLRRGGLRWSAKEFEADGFYLPMEGHDLKIPVYGPYHYGLAIHWAAVFLAFPGLASCLGSPFCPQEKLKDLDSTVSN